MNEHMQTQMQMWENVDQHPLNKEATEILLALENMDPNQEDQLVLEHSHLPILELIERVVGIEGLGLTHPGLPEKWFKLQEMPATQAMRLLEGTHQENSIEQTYRQLEYLREDPLGGLMMHPKPKRWTQIEWTHQDLKRDLINLLEEAGTELDLRQQKINRLMELSTLTPEQAELLSDVVDIAVEDEIDVLSEKETLDDFEQEVLAVLQTYFNNPDKLTTDQEELLKDFVDITVEDEIAKLTQKDILTGSEQRLLAALQAYKTTSQPTQAPEITQETEPKLESTRAPHTNSTQEKVVHHSEDQINASDSASYYFNRGNVKYDLGQYAAAITDFDNAIQLKPDYTFAYNSRGLAKYDLGHYAAAIADFNNALQLKPDSATYYHNRGLAKYDLGQNYAAVIDFDNVIRLKPDYALAYYNRGNAKIKLGQAREAEQDWQTALEHATQSNNVKLKNEIESVLQQSADSQIKPDFKPKQEKVTDHSEDQAKTSEPQVKEKVVRYSEDQIKDIVADYFESLPTASPGYSIKREYLIQMGSDQRRADVVFLRNGKLIAIAECKRTGRVENGIDQLHSYLCATDTFLGIFANDGDPNKWTFWENHRQNNFKKIDRKTFENYVYNHDKTIKDRENKIKAEVQREIDAEIRARVRKNTNTEAIEQNETDRIKQEVMENIDRTAVVNNVRSQITEQAKNGLLNERDKANRKIGREQGFLLTIFSLIGIGILIVLLMTAG